MPTPTANEHNTYILAALIHGPTRTMAGVVRVGVLEALMSRLYTLNTLLRQVPRKLLTSYFHHRGLFTARSFHGVKRNDIETLLEALDTLTPRQRAQVEADFRAVFALANAQGMYLMLTEAAQVGVDLGDLFTQMDNHYHRAMWLLINSRHGDVDLFARCHALAQVEEHSFTESRRLKGLPQREPEHDDSALAELADALRSYYRAQGRGQRCKVEHLRRSSPTRHYFLAWPEDYLTSELRYEDDDLRIRPRQPVLELAFVFNPEEGTLETSAPATLREVSRLQEIFCQVILGLRRRPSTGAQAAFELNGLKRRDMCFPTDIADGIERVDIVSMKLVDPDGARRRIVFEHDPEGAETIHDWIEEAAGAARIPVDTLDVVAARLKVTWAPAGDKPPRTLTFGLRAPDATTLRDEPHHLLIKGYLKRWRLAA